MTCDSGSKRGLRLAPVPRQQLFEPDRGVIGDAGENVGEPGLRIDVFEPGGLDESVTGGDALPPAIGAAEQLCLAADGHAAQGTLCRVVGEAGPAVAQEAGEGVGLASSTTSEWSTIA